MLSTANPDNGL